ncbi:MAG: histone deacetylase family protein [Methanotrichaceae archaeon]|nr:histone deacetylase family protein [Methanotrichaceae archaeon]
MKIVYSPEYGINYPTNPVENPDRVNLAAHDLEIAGYQFIKPLPASPEDIHKIHGHEHVERIKSKGLYDTAALAAGGAICAAELALQGEPAFALIRPPGHHASANRAWGLCFFNNMAIAIQKIRPRGPRALIIDIDLHFGDGTVSIFQGGDKVKIVNPWSVDGNFDYLSMDQSAYMQQVEDAFLGFDYDIVGVSAGFDTYIEDWGGLLQIEDYREIGRIIHEGSKRCGGRRFALLEGGYHPNLRCCVKSFVEGFG